MAPIIYTSTGFSHWKRGPLKTLDKVDISIAYKRGKQSFNFITWWSLPCFHCINTMQVALALLALLICEDFHLSACCCKICESDAMFLHWWSQKQYLLWSCIFCISCPNMFSHSIQDLNAFISLHWFSAALGSSYSGMYSSFNIPSWHFQIFPNKSSPALSCAPRKPSLRSVSQTVQDIMCGTDRKTDIPWVTGRQTTQLHGTSSTINFQIHSLRKVPQPCEQLSSAVTYTTTIGIQILSHTQTHIPHLYRNVRSVSSNFLSSSTNTCGQDHCLPL